jgi:hypothetical protein
MTHVFLASFKPPDHDFDLGPTFLEALVLRGRTGGHQYSQLGSESVSAIHPYPGLDLAK